ncbi:MAG TPA: acyl-CoA dehydrogenase family protein [Chloroflexota bacterium]|nr:acyl-CoA dehydrogenase family protein [Chloroflexota bacterium]HZU07841.1 acyl-CoA dehydrogenase family protein [Chloroflexota bacterium]
MEFSWSAEQEALKATVVAFAQRELNDDVIGRDRRGEFSRRAWEKCAALGIQGLFLPEEYGGGGADPLTTVFVLEGLGYGCRDNGLLFSLNAHMWACEVPIWKFAGPEQRRRYLPRLASGEWIGAHAMTEPGSGSDAYALQTRAERRGDHYVLNGRKTFITNAPVADVFVVFATVDRSKGFYGVTGFVVERGTPGLSVGPHADKMGLRTSPMSDVILEDCVVPAENVLGGEGQGAKVFNCVMEWERTCILASWLGAQQRELERCIEYAKQRRQFGRPIGKFQAVADTIVEMHVRLEAARLLLYKAAWLLGQGQPAVAAAAVAKLFASQAAVQSSLDALRIHGGYGYMTELELERGVRDAIGGTLYSGTTEIQRVLIAAALGL